MAKKTFEAKIEDIWDYERENMGEPDMSGPDCERWYTDDVHSMANEYEEVTVIDVKTYNRDDTDYDMYYLSVTASCEDEEALDSFFEEIGATRQDGEFIWFMKSVEA